MNTSYNPFSLQGKRILITGASSGIGRQCAIDCSRMGAKITLVGRNMERLLETVSSLKGSSHIAITGDITDYDDITKKIIRTIESEGRLDGFIHSAGIEQTKLLRDLKPNDCLQIFNINFVSGINLLKVLTKKSNYNTGFKAVFIASIAALIARVGTLAYAASKGAIISAVRELAVELAPKGININCISPGTILTPMMQTVLKAMTEVDAKKRLEGFPLGVGHPEDISRASIFLLSEGARWITGQNLVVDGGYTSK